MIDGYMGAVASIYLPLLLACSAVTFLLGMAQALLPKRKLPQSSFQSMVAITALAGFWPFMLPIGFASMWIAALVGATVFLSAAMRKAKIQIKRLAS